MLLLWKTPRLWVTCLQSTESCSVSDNFMCWWRFFQVALLPYHGRISSKVLCKFEVSTLLFLLEIYRNLLSRYFTVFVFCNWSLLCLSFIDWFMEYCPVAWQRQNTQVSVKQSTSGQREKRPPTQVSNAHAQMLWKSWQSWRGSPTSRCWLLKNKWWVTLHMLWMERYKLSF